MIHAITRSLVLGSAAVITTLILVMPTVGYASERTNDVRKLAQLYERANSALLQGDVVTWHALVPMAKNFVLMSPFGGEPSRHSDYTPERMERMGEFFRNGRFRQELLESYAVDGMIVLVTIEHCNVEVGGLPAQDWPLRVTSVFTRDGSRWMLAHRHADPLVEGVSLAEAARLARGERMPTNR